MEITRLKRKESIFCSRLWLLSGNQKEFKFQKSKLSWKYNFLFPILQIRLKRTESHYRWSEREKKRKKKKERKKEKERSRQSLPCPLFCWDANRKYWTPNRRTFQHKYNPPSHKHIINSNNRTVRLWAIFFNHEITNKQFCNSYKFSCKFSSKFSSVSQVFLLNSLRPLLQDRAK